MRTRACSMILALAVLSTFTACEADPVGAEPDGSSFAAAVAGDVEATYEGRGYFHTFTPPRGVPRPAMFTVHSADPDRVNGQVQSFSLRRWGTELPAVGSYSIGNVSPMESDSQDFSAIYYRMVGNAVELYTGTSGEVRVTASSADRIEGTFRFTGVRTCTGTRGQMLCAVHVGPDASSVDSGDQVRIEVTGSFIAIPAPARHTRVP